MKVLIVDANAFRKWASKTKEEILADMRACFAEIDMQGPVEPFEPREYPKIQIPQFRPIPPTPQSVARQRAMSVFGPKRGRWK